MIFPLPSVKSALRHYFRLRLGGLSSLDLARRKDRGKEPFPQEARQQMMADFASLAACLDLTPQESLLLFLDCYLNLRL